MAQFKPATEASAEEMALLDAARKGDSATVKGLIDSGVNIDARDHREIRWDVTSLMHAAGGGHLDIVKLLLDAGVNVNLKDTGIPGMEDGLGTALQYAINSGHEEIAQLLLRSGAKANVKAGGSTPLEDAVDRRLIPTVQLLLECGANPNRRSSMKRVPLHSAAQKGDFDLVRMLLVAGSEVNIQDGIGDSPLVYAADDGHAETVRQLLGAGADPNIPGVRGKTPLMAAVLAGSEGAVQALIRAGAKLNAADEEGRTALDFALRDGLKSITELLRGAGGRTGSERHLGRDSSLAEDKSVRHPAGETPELTAAAEELAAASGASAIRSAEIPGGVFFKVSEEERRTLVHQFHDSFLSQGIYTFASNHHLGLYPTTDKYEVLRAMGTSGTNYGITTELIIAELKAIEKEQAFILLGIGPDFVSGEFTGALKNGRDIAKRLFKLCPDIVDQGAGTLAQAAAELKRSRQLFLWWD